MQFINMVFNWIFQYAQSYAEWFWPGTGDLVPFRIACFFLTAVWLIWLQSKKEGEQFSSIQLAANTVGSFVLAASLFAIILGFVLVPVTLLLGLFPGEWGWWRLLIGAVIVAFLWWLVAKLISAVGGWMKMGVIWAWGAAKKAYDWGKGNPNVLLMLLGVSGLAGVITSDRVTQMTANLFGEGYLPGVIPGVSGLIGVFTLIFSRNMPWRDKEKQTVGEALLGRAQVKLTNKPDSQGRWLCRSPVFMHDRHGRIYFQGLDTPVHYGSLEQMKTAGFVPRTTTCGTWNDATDTSCRSEGPGNDWCNCLNPFANKTCPRCGKTGIPYDRAKCPEEGCGAPLPKNPTSAPPTHPGASNNIAPAPAPAQPAVAPQAAPVQAAPQAAVPARQPAGHQPANWRLGNQHAVTCLACNHQNPFGAVYCGNCNNFLLTQDRLQTPADTTDEDGFPDGYFN